MVSRLSLLLACVASLAGTSLGQNVCSTTSWGKSIGVAYSLAPAVLHAGIENWRVHVTVPQSCHYGGVNAITAVACDYDSRPQVKFLGKTDIYVHRTGTLSRTGSVRVSVYCSPYSAEQNKPAYENVF